MTDVLFVRTPINAAAKVTEVLKNLYRAGWHVVSHTESSDEYTFVMEGGTLPPTPCGKKQFRMADGGCGDNDSPLDVAMDWKLRGL